MSNCANRIQQNNNVLRKMKLQITFTSPSLPEEIKNRYNEHHSLPTTSQLQKIIICAIFKSEIFGTNPK